jgi:hypothetical protein
MNATTALACVALITTLFAAVLYWVPAPKEKDAAFRPPTRDLMKGEPEQMMFPRPRSSQSAAAL